MTTRKTCPAGRPIADHHALRCHDDENDAMRATIRQHEETIADLTRKGEGMCMYIGELMMACRRLLCLDLVEQARMDSFSPDAARVRALVTTPEPIGDYAIRFATVEAIRAERDAALATVAERDATIEQFEEGFARTMSERDEAIVQIVLLESRLVDAERGSAEAKRREVLRQRDFESRDEKLYWYVTELNGTHVKLATAEAQNAELERYKSANENHDHVAGRLALSAKEAEVRQLTAALQSLKERLTGVLLASDTEAGAAFRRALAQLKSDGKETK